MAKRDNYHFEDFTLDKYSELLDFAKGKFQFVDFQNYEAGSNNLIWRHDVDFSVSLALDMAIIEAEKGIKSTFFVLLHSEYYDLNEYNQRADLFRILNMGHRVGLHFDASRHKIKNVVDLDKCIAEEKLEFSRAFNVPIDTFAFHLTDDFTMSCEAESYGGLLNVYSRAFKKIPYCSDSCGYWRYNRLDDMLKSNETLNVLTHDIWWTKDVLSPREKLIESVLKGDYSDESNQYKELLLKFNLIDIDWGSV